MRSLLCCVGLLLWRAAALNEEGEPKVVMLPDAGATSVRDTEDIDYVVGLLPVGSEAPVPMYGGYRVRMTSESGMAFDCVMPDPSAPVPEDPPPEPSVPKTRLLDLPSVISNFFSKQMSIQSQGLVVLRGVSREESYAIS